VRTTVVYGVSLALHVALAGGVLAMRKTPRRERVAVVLREVKKPAAHAAAEPPKPPAPPLPAPPPPRAAPRRVAVAHPRPAPAAPRPAPSAAPPAPAVADFGLTLAGGAGPAAGLAVPAGGGAAPPPAPDEVRHARPKLLAARPAEDDCADGAAIKPKPIHVVQPTYTDDARAAQIAGKVRVEITVGADGAITEARVLQGLGHGLDEAALEAARASTFEPGTRCGKQVATTFTIGMRFAL
jgi:protein TonB